MPNVMNGGGGAGRMAPPILLNADVDTAAADKLAAEIMAATGAWDRGTPAVPTRAPTARPLAVAPPAAPTTDPELLAFDMAAEIIATACAVEPCGS